LTQSRLPNAKKQQKASLRSKQAHDPVCVNATGMRKEQQIVHFAALAK